MPARVESARAPGRDATSIRVACCLKRGDVRPGGGADYHTEYVELVNIGDTTTDIGGWRVGDGKELDEIVGDDLALKAGQYALVLDGSYAGAAISTYESLPAEALVVAIDDKAFGLRGWSNSVASTVVLRDAAGDTVETFSYSLMRQPGRLRIASSCH